VAFHGTGGFLDGAYLEGLFAGYAGNGFLSFSFLLFTSSFCGFMYSFDYEGSKAAKTSFNSSGAALCCRLRTP